MAIAPTTVPVTDPNDSGPLDDLGAATKALEDSIVASGELDDDPITPTQGVEDGTPSQAPAQPGNEGTPPVVEGQPIPQDPSQAAARATPDDKNNLVDAQGQVVAYAGRERRLYETGIQQKAELVRASQQVQTLQAQVNEVKLLNEMPQKYGLDNNQVQQGLQLIKAYSDDPIGTLKYILTEAKAAGHNLDDLVGPGTDMTAIGRMLDERLAPLTKAHDAQVQSDESTATGNRLYQEFITKHADATLHEDTLAQMLQADPSTALEAHYWRLKHWVTEKGLDWTKPLSAQAAQPVQQQSAQQPAGAVMPGGATAPQAVPTIQESGGMAPAEMETEDIVRESMREAGIQY